MKNTLIVLFFCINTVAVFSQSSASERFPVFPNCENLNGKELESCFYTQLQDFVFNNFQVPDNLKQNNYKGTVSALFEVDTTGAFKVQYVDAIYPELIKETKRIFAMLPKIKPPTYNGQPTYSKYTYKIAIPLQNGLTVTAVQPTADELKKERNKELTELDSMVYKKFDNPVLKSHLNIPFSHSYYSQFDAALNQVGSNNHTGSKPFSYAEVSKYYDLDAANKKLQKDKTGWWGRKLWNENFVQIQGEGYWFTLNPLLDVRVGKAARQNQVILIKIHGAYNFREVWENNWFLQLQSMRARDDLRIIIMTMRNQ